MELKEGKKKDRKKWTTVPNGIRFNHSKNAKKNRRTKKKKKMKQTERGW